MKQILIFENEYSYVEAPFEYVKDVYFDNKIEYTVYPNSQLLKPFSDISKFDYVFIDISLGANSELDGFGIIKKIESEQIEVNKIIILTGNHLIEHMLKERGITGEYPILTKPIDFKDLLDILSE